MYKLPELEYEYDALGEYISKDIMSLHHKNHHQAYVDKLNKALEGVSVDKNDLQQLLANLDSLPESVRTTVRNNGGGHLNHTLFWQCVGPNGGGEPSGELATAINDKYGSFQDFVDAFSEAALGVFGSGWVWLDRDCSISTSPNQDSPVMAGKDLPILGLDVWEHAYYLDYTYKRADYVTAWWNVVDWQRTAESYRAKENAELQLV